MDLKQLFAALLVMLCGLACAESTQVNTDDLAGRKFHPNGLYAIWTGLSGTIPAQARVDFHKQLTLAWALKCQRNKCTDAAQAASNSLPGRYPTKPTRLSMTRYLSSIDAELQKAYADMDWEALASEYRLSKAEGVVLRQLAQAIGARELVAYSLTELMPSPTDGDLNVEVLRFLLRYAGREYIELLPAVNDKYTSFGPYQFTAYALYDNGGETRGASRANQALTKRAIPGSVLKLKGPNHHRAAWLFAIDNLAKIVKGWNKPGLKVLGRLAERPGELVKVIACSHHAPVPCKKAAERWIAQGAKGQFQMSGRVRQYVVKTAHNWRAMN